MSAHFRNGHAFNACFEESLLHVLKYTGLNNRFELSHLLSLSFYGMANLWHAIQHRNLTCSDPRLPD
jgi:hypothetical protein